MNAPIVLERTELTVTTTGAVATIAERLGEYSRQAEGAFAPNTLRAIRSDSATFAGWCAARGLCSLPATPETVAAFIDDQATTKAPATVRRCVSSISHLHRAARVANPTSDDVVRLALKRMHRAKGRAQKQAPALGYADVQRIVDATGNTVRDLRDRALILTGYDLAARRSELAALDLADISFVDDGTGAALIRRSKVDQEGVGAVCFLAADTCAALREYIAAAGLTEGALFRAVRKGARVGDRLDHGTVAAIFERLAGTVGKSASGHSLRVGCAQDASAAGMTMPEIMQLGRWSTPAMVATYTRNQSVRRGAGAKLAALQGRL